MTKGRSKHIELTDDDYYDYDSNYDDYEYSDHDEYINNNSKIIKKKNDNNLHVNNGINNHHHSNINNIKNKNTQNIQNNNNTINNYICSVLGHVDSGKSTLMGQLFVKLGLVNENLLRKYKKESENIGKGSFFYAWIFDECDDERERGITINVCAKYIKLNDKLITLLDTPGHSEFISNSFSVTMFSDNIIIVIDSINFHSNFEKGQTKEYIISSLISNTSNIIIAINKLDLCDWNKDNYDQIVGIIDNYINSELNDIKHNCNIIYIPISAYNAVNIIDNNCDKSIDVYSWYNNLTLFQILSNIDRDQNKYKYNSNDICNCNNQKKQFIKFCACIVDIISISSNEFKASIYLNFGTLKIGNNYLLISNNEIVKCKNIIINDKSYNICNGPIYISSVTFQSNIHPNIGNLIISDVFNYKNKNSHNLLSNIHPILITKKIKIRIIKLINQSYFQNNNIYWQIPGKSFMLYYHCESVSATLNFIKKDIYYFETDQDIVTYNNCLCNNYSNLSKVSVRFFGTTVFIGEMIY